MIGLNLFNINFMKKNLFILGASGSIGSQTLEILPSFLAKYNLVGVSIGHNVSFLENHILPYFDVKYVFILEEEHYLYLKEKYKNIIFFHGENNIPNMLEEIKDDVDVILNALVGFSGLIPSLWTVKNNKILLLANKESLVIGGEYIKKIIGDKKLIYPIDSEHAAITKCLHNVKKEDLIYICLTCSGGPFFNYKKEDFKGITYLDALKHPTYSMGSKITIDSSTLMNKAFEIIEAYYIFGVNPSKIRVLIDRNSYVHSFICLKDGTYKLSVGKPDMRIQIKDALNLFELDEKHEFPDTEINTFDKYKFHPVDKEKFPLIDYGYYVIGHKGLSGLILNDADEICYKYFKEGVISYLDIKKVIDKTFYELSNILDLELNEENLFVLDKQIRDKVKEIILRKEFN